MSTRQQSARTRIRRLATGRLISITGGAAAYTALNFTVWERTHSPSMQALSLLAHLRRRRDCSARSRAALGDRFDRRNVMIWSEAISACVLRRDGCSRDAPTMLIGSSRSARRSRSCRSSRLRARRSRTSSTRKSRSPGRTAWSRWVCTPGIAVGPVDRGRSADPFGRVLGVRPQRTDVRRVVGADAHGARELPGAIAGRPRRPTDATAASCGGSRLPMARPGPPADGDRVVRVRPRAWA